MVLILRALSYKGLPPIQPISAQFDEQGGTLGRAPNNHLVLPDPDKFISRGHASIIFADGRYFIEDSSTGGTFINESTVPLQQSKAPLSDGDRLRIGEYELLVTIAESDTSGFAVSIEQPVRQLDMAQKGILDEPLVPQQSAVPKAKSDFFSSFVEQPDSSSIHQNFTPPQVAEVENKPVEDDLDFGDLLSKLDELPGAGSVSATSVQSSELPPLPADFFADEPESANLEQPVQAQPETPPPFSPFTAEVPSSEPASSFLQEKPEVSTPEPAMPAAAPIESPQSVGEQSVVDQHPARASSSSVASDGVLLREFLAGVGISDPNFLPAEQWPVMMRTSGELLRSMVQGLMQVLRARAEIKSQFRVSVTTMRSVDNNPLKFTPNVDDAIKLILAPTNPGFLPPKQAVSEGFNDIMNHQIAMTAGIQAALAEILRSFDPQPIEKNQAEGVLFQKKAKCWEYYVEKYPQLKAVAQEEFFGDAFAEAYEKQMLLLGRAKNQ